MGIRKRETEKRQAGEKEHEGDMDQLCDGGPRRRAEHRRHHHLVPPWAPSRGESTDQEHNRQRGKRHQQQPRITAMRELEVVNRQGTPLATNRASQRGKNFGSPHTCDCLRYGVVRTTNADRPESATSSPLRSAETDQKYVPGSSGTSSGLATEFVGMLFWRQTSTSTSFQTPIE